MTSDQSWEKLSDTAAPSARGSVASAEEEEEAAPPLPCSPSIVSPDFQSHRLDKSRGASGKRWVGGWRGGAGRHVVGARRPPEQPLLLPFAKTLPFNALAETLQTSPAPGGRCALVYASLRSDLRVIAERFRVNRRRRRGWSSCAARDHSGSEGRPLKTIKLGVRYKSLPPSSRRQLEPGSIHAREERGWR